MRRSPHLCYACAEMLVTSTPGTSRRGADLTQLFASFLTERYTRTTAQKLDFRGGLFDSVAVICIIG